MALCDLLIRIGLADEPDVTPSSITAWAGVEVFEQTGGIQEVARHLGLRSLDRAAPVIGHTWRQTTMTADAPGEPQPQSEVLGA
ncbi:hypothetical protein [Streptomyces noursei]|uniref:hypothetical protein n=1 Tax=Streptomyces noursei TaxID=1971 RepID=UPI00381DA4CF